MFEKDESRTRIIQKKTNQLVSSTHAKIVQKESRAEAQQRGTAGRVNKKGKAQSTNKPYGGKMAR